MEFGSILQFHSPRNSFRVIRIFTNPASLTLADDFSVSTAGSRVIPSTDNGGLEISPCLDMKNIGKPCAGSGVGRAFAKQKRAKLHARFDEGGQAKGCSLLSPEFARHNHPPSNPCLLCQAPKGSRINGPGKTEPVAEASEVGRI